MDRYLSRDPFLAQDSRAGGEGKELLQLNVLARSTWVIGRIQECPEH